MESYKTAKEYSVDVNLFSYINDNNNLSEEQKKNLYDMLNVIKSIYDRYIGDYTFDNVSEIIKTLKIVEADENHEISYDKNNNELILGKSDKNQEYNTYKSLFELTSQRYDRKTNSYVSGIIVKSSNGDEYGKNLNELLISKIITYNTSYSNKEESISQNDELLKNITDKVGAEKLVSCFAYAHGKMLYSKIFSNDTEIKIK